MRPVTAHYTDCIVPHDIPSFSSAINLNLTKGFSLGGNRILTLARKIHDFTNTKGLAMVQIRCLGGFETKNEAFA